MVGVFGDRARAVNPLGRGAEPVPVALGRAALEQLSVLDTDPVIERDLVQVRAHLGHQQQRGQRQTARRSAEGLETNGSHGARRFG